ncbi:MAG TPA: hypothetical protein PK830_05775 [Candidatus Atribacteria bacterium]|nr:hypothetical protein [Candidatus Atribacteria bacterium]HPT78591.1 hypothetical protein [Candidatus Atribacteria bacterium]
MPLFSAADRKNVLDHIVSFTEPNEHIITLVAVGSGSYGFYDELSDLDFVIALDSDDSMETVMEYVRSQLGKRLNFIYYKQIPQKRLQVFLTDNYLEIDIGYGAYTGAAAFRKHWKVLFDKSGTVDKAMRSSWEQTEADFKANGHSRKLAECADSVWHNLMLAAVAIKRRQYWRAYAELELARNRLIELVCCRYSLDADRNREVDKLPETELAILNATLVSSLTQEALWRHLDVLTDAIYTELERYSEQSCITVSRRQVNEYINACRK